MLKTTSTPSSPQKTKNLETTSIFSPLPSKQKYELQDDCASPKIRLLSSDFSFQHTQILPMSSVSSGDSHYSSLFSNDQGNSQQWSESKWVLQQEITKTLPLHLRSSLYLNPIAPHVPIPQMEQQYNFLANQLSSPQPKSSVIVLDIAIKQIDRIVVVETQADLD